MNLYQNDLGKRGECKLSLAWRNAFESEYGKAKDFVVHWAYREGLASVRHRLSYAMRNPVVDCYKAIGKFDYRPELDRGWTTRMLLRPKTEKRTQWFGYLSDNQKSKYLKMLEYKLEPKAVRRRKRSRRVCLDDGTDISWNFVSEDLDYAMTYHPERPVMTFGVPKTGGEFWKK